MLKKEPIREADKGSSFESNPIQDHEIILLKGDAGEKSYTNRLPKEISHEPFLQARNHHS
ncbi:MAG TPA: hypothetical protein VK982_01845 [Bacteroidales bacterium]|nr:hypothetical protein [Bacteroidales bacterium]